jgi:hypothetical protein
MRKKLLWFALFAALFAWFGKDGQAQPGQTARHIFYGGTLPATCSARSGDVFALVSGASATYYDCTAANTWTAVPTSSGASPAGSPPDVQFQLNATTFGADTAKFDYITNAVGTPPDPTITQAGTPGMTSYTYETEAKNAIGLGVVSNTVTTTTGNAALSGTNYNIVHTTCGSMPAGTVEDVWRTAGGATQGLIGTVVCGSAFNDTGIASLTQSNTISPGFGTDPTNGLLINKNLNINGYMQVGPGATLGNITPASAGATPIQGLVQGDSQTQQLLSQLVVTGAQVLPANEFVQGAGLSVYETILPDIATSYSTVYGQYMRVSAGTIAAPARALGTMYGSYTNMVANVSGTSTDNIIGYQVQIGIEGVAGTETVTTVEDFRAGALEANLGAVPFVTSHFVYHSLADIDSALNTYSFAADDNTPTVGSLADYAFWTNQATHGGGILEWAFYGAGNAPSHLGGLLDAPGLVSSATKFTTSGAGCTVTATTGGATAGSFTTTTTGTCTTTITMNGATGLTAPNGWSCFAADITAAHLVDFNQTATTQTTCTIAGATTSGDTVVFQAQGY